MPRLIRAATRPTKQVLGIDPSLSSTGFAYRRDGQVFTGRIDAGKLKGPARLAYIARNLEALLLDVKPGLIVYEDYADRAIGKVYQIGELGGVLKTLFWDRKIDVMLVKPAAVKRAIAGHGHADAGKRINGKLVKDKSKPMMRNALATTFNLDLQQNDEADACALMLIGEMYFGTHTVARSIQTGLKLDRVKDCTIVTGRGNQLQLIAGK